MHPSSMRRAVAGATCLLAAQLLGACGGGAAGNATDVDREDIVATPPASTPTAPPIIAEPVVPPPVAEPEPPAEPVPPPELETSPEPAPEPVTPPVSPPSPEPATPPEASADPCTSARLVERVVSTAAQLQAALADVRPGQRIRLAPGLYTGHFRTTVSGRSDAPIALCGPRDAVLDGDTTDRGYGLHLDGASYWHLAGFTVTRSKKGIVLDHASHNELRELLVRDIGEEAIHLRRFSSDNLVAASEIRDTGRLRPGVGEGIYIGASHTQWVDMTGDAAIPDMSDRNRIIGNVIGPGVTAEHVDIKEGTAGGEVRGNVFHGAGLSGENGGDSWIDVKGNDYLVVDNRGYDALLDGFQTHVRTEHWGHGNRFERNAVHGARGYGFAIDPKSRNTTVRCDNDAAGAAKGLANVACAP